MIHQMDMYHIRQRSNATPGQLVTGDYYYAIDNGRLYKATSKKAVMLINNIYYVAADHDRRRNVSRITGKYYYVIDVNELWIFNEMNQWELVDNGYENQLDVKDAYYDTGFYDGNIMFAKTFVSTFKWTENEGEKSSPITVVFQKFNRAIFGSFSINMSKLPEWQRGTAELGYLPSELFPKQATILRIECFNETTGAEEIIHAKVHINEEGVTDGLITVLGDSEAERIANIKKLTNSSKFWFALHPVTYEVIE